MGERGLLKKVAVRQVDCRHTLPMAPPKRLLGADRRGEGGKRFEESARQV